VRHLFEELGLPPQATYKVAKIIDLLVKNFPGQAVRIIEETFLPQMQEDDLEVTVEYSQAA
jgi:hypothetical protein